MSTFSTLNALQPFNEKRRENEKPLVLLEVIFDEYH